jgi:Tfp pilus assembly protein PilO
MSPLDAKSLKAQAMALLEKPQAFLAVVAVALILDAAFILRWQVVSLGRMFGEGRKIRSDIVATYGDSKEVESQKKLLADCLAQQERLNKMIIGPQDLPKALEVISGFADISSVRILRIQPVAAGKPSGSSPDKFSRQKISITASAGYHPMGRFIGLLESAPIFIDIKNLEVQGNQAEAGMQHVTILLEVLQRK